MLSRDEIKQLEKEFATKIQVDKILRDLHDSLNEKGRRILMYVDHKFDRFDRFVDRFERFENTVMTTLDGLVKDNKDFKDELLLISNRQSIHTNQLEDNDKRIKKLEKNN